MLVCLYIDILVMIFHVTAGCISNRQPETTSSDLRALSAKTDFFSHGTKQLTDEVGRVVDQSQ